MCSVELRGTCYGIQGETAKMAVQLSELCLCASCWATLTCCRACGTKKKLGKKTFLKSVVLNKIKYVKYLIGSLGAVVYLNTKKAQYNPMTFRIW